MRRHGYSELLMWALFEKMNKGMSIREAKETYGISNNLVQGWTYRVMMENGKEEEARQIARSVQEEDRLSKRRKRHADKRR